MLSWIIAFCISIYVVGTLGSDNEHLIEKDHSDIDFKHLRSLQKNYGIQNIFNATELIRGIRNGDKIVEEIRVIWRFLGWARETYMKSVGTITQKGAIGTTNAIQQ